MTSTPRQRSCQARFGRNATSADLAEALDVTPNELGSTRAQVCRMRVVALDELLSTGLSGENVSLAETLADPFAQAPGDALEQRDVLAALQAALAAMPERERAVLVQSYIEGLTLSQIGHAPRRDGEPGLPDPDQGASRGPQPAARTPRRLTIATADTTVQPDRADARDHRPGVDEGMLAASTAHPDHRRLFADAVRPKPPAVSPGSEFCHHSGP